MTSTGATAGADRLRAAGLRVTAGRVAALEALEVRSHVTADELQREVASHVPMTLQAVYLMLQTLTDHDLVRRIEPAGSPARYEVRVGDNHHHLVCERCARIVDVDCDSDVVPCLLPTATHGFRVREAEVTFWGVCPECAAAAAEEEEGAV